MRLPARRSKFHVIYGNGSKMTCVSALSSIGNVRSTLRRTQTPLMQSLSTGPERANSGQGAFAANSTSDTDPISVRPGTWISMPCLGVETSRAPKSKNPAVSGSKPGGMS